MFYSHANKTHFHENGFALSFVLKARVFLELGNNVLEKTQKKKAIKVSSLRADVIFCFFWDPKDHWIAPVIVIGQLTANRSTTTIEETEHLPVAEKKDIYRNWVVKRLEKPKLEAEGCACFNKILVGEV